MVGAAPATGDGAALAQTANLHGASESEQAQPLGLVPSTAAAWAIEMGVADDAPVWSVYALAEVEAQGLFGTDSADIVVQDPVGQGRRLTRARLFPSATSTRFALRRLQRPGRLAFRGKFEFRQAWAAVETGTPGEVYKVVSARHSRLGDQTAAMDLASQTTTALLPGDTLSLIYRRSQSNTDDASGWFMIVGGPGAEVPTVRNRPSRPPTAAALPKVFALHTNRPNPFARSTSMRFALPRSEHVRIEVFDLLGRRVRTVADGAFEAGEHERPWDGRDAGGALVPAGVYLTRMHAGEFQAQRTMVLLPSGR